MKWNKIAQNLKYVKMDRKINKDRGYKWINNVPYCFIDTVGQKTLSFPNAGGTAWPDREPGNKTNS